MTRTWKAGELVTASILNEIKGNMTTEKTAADRLDSQTGNASASATGGSNTSGRMMIVTITATWSASGGPDPDYYWMYPVVTVGGVAVINEALKSRDVDTVTLEHTVFVPPGSSWACSGGTAATETFI